MMTLVTELERIRTDNGWSVRRMAEELRVGASTYCHFRNGRRNAGRKVLAGVANRFPWLDLRYFVASTGDYSQQTVPGGASVAPPARQPSPKGKDTTTGSASRTGRPSASGEVAA
jgi:transcriptional regulator with XRE-family HTH domain